jgi:hypothetical protein
MLSRRGECDARSDVPNILFSLEASEQASRGDIATTELSDGRPLDNSAVTGSEPDDGKYAELFFEAIETALDRGEGIAQAVARQFRQTVVRVCKVSGHSGGVRAVSLPQCGTVIADPGSGSAAFGDEFVHKGSPLKGRASNSGPRRGRLGMVYCGL